MNRQAVDEIVVEDSVITKEEGALIEVGILVEEGHPGAHQVGPGAGAGTTSSRGSPAPRVDEIQMRF